MGKNYIEWGHLRGSKKIKNFSVLGNDAYVLWHLAVRYKEVLQLQNQKKKKISFNKLPRKEKFFLLYIFYLLNKPNKIVELGSSAMEVIDGLELSEKFFNDKFSKSDLTKVGFSGIEESDILRLCSKNSHSNRKIKLYKNVKDYLKKNFRDSKTMLHDFGVSNYAFNNSNEFTNFLNRFGSGYLKLSLSNEKTFSIIPRGKKINFFSIRDMKKLKKPFYFLFNDYKIKKWTILEDDKELKKKSITGFFYFGEIKNLETIIQKSKMKRFFKKINFRPVKIN